MAQALRQQKRTEQRNSGAKLQRISRAAGLRGTFADESFKDKKAGGRRLVETYCESGAERRETGGAFTFLTPQEAPAE